MPKSKPPVNRLLEAVKFVQLAQTGKGVEAETHCAIRYGQVIVTSRTMAAGSPINEDDLDCCAHTEYLKLALESCGPQYSMIQLPDSLAMRSGEFSGFVPLCDPALLTLGIPDEPQSILGDEFKATLKVTGLLVKDSAATVLQSCIQLNPYACCSTNGNVILEAWHGFDMPPGLLIPKGFAAALCKTKKIITSFGFTPATFTVQFGDGCWMRTNLYKEAIPNIVGKLSDVYDRSSPWPADFFKHVDEIAKWSQDARLYIHDFLMSSHPPSDERMGSVLAFPTVELLQETSYSISSLQLISKLATRFEDRTKPLVTMFYGNRLRGAIAHERIERAWEAQGISDDDIPF